MHTSDPERIIMNSDNVDKDRNQYEPLPASKKLFVEGKQAGVRVPMREIRCTPTRSQLPGGQDTPNYALTVSIKPASKRFTSLGASIMGMCPAPGMMVVSTEPGRPAACEAGMMLSDSPQIT